MKIGDVSQASREDRLYLKRTLGPLSGGTQVNLRKLIAHDTVLVVVGNYTKVVHRTRRDPLTHESYFEEVYRVTKEHELHVTLDDVVCRRSKSR